MELEVCLRMIAYGALFGGSCAYYDVTAVAAFPNLNLASLKHFFSLYVAKKCAVSFLVSLLNCRNASELLSKLVESFLVSLASHSVVHICPLVVLALSRVEKVFSCIADAAESLEPKLSVFLFVFSCCEEERCDLLEALLLCYGREVCIFISRLAFTCESFPEVLLCPCSRERLLLFCYCLEEGSILLAVSYCS